MGFTCNSHFNMTVKNSKQSLETKPPQFYKVSLLKIIVIVIDVLIGGFTGGDLRWLARVTVFVSIKYSRVYS